MSCRISFLLLMFLALFLPSSVSCSGGTAPTYPKDLPDFKGVSSFITADHGGTLQISGARLYIPPDALTADTEVTLKAIPAGAVVGGSEIAGGVEILPHLLDLNGPVLIQFPLQPGLFKPDAFSRVQHLVDGGFQPYRFRDQTASFALISADADRALLSADHFSTIALLMEQANNFLNNTDVAFDTLETIQLRNDARVYYDDDILADSRMKYYLGGWPQVDGGEEWLPELFGLVSPGDVYALGVRKELYLEIFGDLLTMRSFADRYNQLSSPEMTPLDSIVPSIKSLF